MPAPANSTRPPRRLKGDSPLSIPRPIVHKSDPPAVTPAKSAAGRASSERQSPSMKEISTSARTPVQEAAWQNLWSWLLGPDDEPSPAPRPGPRPNEQPAAAEEGRAA